jgi:hypothetical protein
MTQPNDVLMPEIVAGIKAAGLAAIEQARRTGTKLIIWRDNQIMEISPDEAEVMLREDEAKSKQ